MGSLGSRGVVFTEEWPVTFAKAVSSAGDVSGDGLSDVLLLHHDADLTYRLSVFLVYGRRTFPDVITAPDLKGFATVFELSTPTRGPVIRGTAPAGDLDGDGLDDFLI